LQNSQVTVLIQEDQNLATSQPVDTERSKLQIHRKSRHEIALLEGANLALSCIRMLRRN
jgi:predicted anti-sigma-YlaC factor YlaD